jgi:hypothetical protein
MASGNKNKAMLAGIAGAIKGYSDIMADRQKIMGQMMINKMEASNNIFFKMQEQQQQNEYQKKISNEVMQANEKAYSEAIAAGKPAPMQELQVTGGNIGTTRPPLAEIDPKKIVEGKVFKSGVASLNPNEKQIWNSVPGKQDINVGLKEEQRQDRLEKIASDRLMKIVSNRSGGIGMQDSKVNQAIHLRSLGDQYFNQQTKTYEIPGAQFNEMLIGLASLVSNSTVATVEQLRGVTPKTVQSDMASMVSYWTGKPKTANTQAMIKNLMDSIDRQGQVSEKLRDKYFDNIQNMMPKDLDKDRRDILKQTHMGSSFEEYLKNSPSRQSGGSESGKSQYQEGATYQDAKGNKARYQNGQWVPM